MPLARAPAVLATDGARVRLRPAANNGHPRRPPRWPSKVLHACVGGGP
jgi:hypothetical protein